MGSRLGSLHAEQSRLSRYSLGDLERVPGVEGEKMHQGKPHTNPKWMYLVPGSRQQVRTSTISQIHRMVIS